jgi:hypothetical protein
VPNLTFTAPKTLHQPAGLQGKGTLRSGRRLDAALEQLAAGRQHADLNLLGALALFCL